MINTLKSVNLFLMIAFCVISVMCLLALALEIFLPLGAKVGLVGMFTTVVFMGLLEEFDR